MSREHKIVDCHCLDEDREPFEGCPTCRGRGFIRLRCSCGADSVVSHVNGRDHACLLCFIRWDDRAEEERAEQCDVCLGPAVGVVCGVRICEACAADHLDVTRKSYEAA